MDPPSIDIHDIIGELQKIFGLDPCGIFLPCTLGTKLFQKIYDAKLGEIQAPKVILHHLQMNHQKALQIHLSELTRRTFDTVTNPPPTPTLGYIPQHVRNNTAKEDHKKLLADAGIKKPDKSLGARIESIMVSLDGMSPEDREKVFVDVQKVVLLNIITKLVKKKQGIGANIKDLRDLEIEIYKSTHSLDNMYRLINEYILHMYNTISSTTSDKLLKFIRNNLQVLSASLSQYYQGEKDIIDFKIYLPLLQKYIELVLRESFNELESILLKGDSIEIAKLIMVIISRRICAFVQVAGDPSICIRHTIVHNAEKLIIEGVRNFLLNYTAHAAAHAAAADPDDDLMTNAGGSLNRNRNHTRIKKYKNRTKHRTKRRTKYRTKCKTKYRTSRRYKIKNKKTRKVYKY